MPAAPNGASFETGHADMVHDTQLDYYGRVRRLPGPRLCASLCSSATHSLVSSHTLFFSSLQRLATCSSDRVIKVFDVAGDSRTHVADLTGHTGPVRPLARGGFSLSFNTAPQLCDTHLTRTYIYTSL
jgi:protein transport protein SEC13